MEAMTKKSVSETNRRSARMNTKHRINAFENRGSDALQPYQRAYLIELRNRFETEPGRLEYRKDLAVALAMICDMGFGHLREIAEKGGDIRLIWEGGVISRLGTYINTLARLLDNWPKESSGKNIIDVLKGGEDEAA
jgi:hypothetical protein